MWVYSTYDTELHGNIDMYRLEVEMNCRGGVSSLAAMERACNWFSVCRVAVDALVLTGLGKAYRYLKRILS